MSGLESKSALWKRYKLRAESADRDHAALMAAHATLVELGERG